MDNLELKELRSLVMSIRATPELDVERATQKLSNLLTESNLRARIDEWRVAVGAPDDYYDHVEKRVPELKATLEEKQRNERTDN